MISTDMAFWESSMKRLLSRKSVSTGALVCMIKASLVRTFPDIFGRFSSTLYDFGPLFW